MSEEPEDKQDDADDLGNPGQERLSLKTLAEQIGPYGETLSVMAVTCAIVLPLFMWEWLPWYIWLLLSVVLLIAAVGAFRSAVQHAEWLKEEKNRSSVAEKSTTYQITEARILTLKAVGVPDDIIKVMRKALGLGLLLPGVPPAPLAPSDPMPKQKFLSWLMYDLDLGQVRVEECEETILKYAVYHEKPARESQEAPDSSTLSASQFTSDGGAAVQIN